MPKIWPPRNENFQKTNAAIFHISDQNIVCGYTLGPHWRGGSNEYLQSMFEQSKKNNVQSNFNGSNIFGNSFETWVVRATEG